MKRILLALSAIALSTTVAFPAAALNERFDEAREQTMNKLNERFDEAREQTMNKLNERFSKSYKETLNR
jgi:predicted nuclease with TOPRIM domain